MTTEVNLLQTKAPQSARVKTIQSQLKIANYIVVIVIIACSLFIGAGYMYIKTSSQQLVNTKKQYIASIANLSTREVLLSALKDRLKLAIKIRETQYSYDKVFVLIDRLGTASSFNSVSIAESGTVQTSLRLENIEEAFSFMNNLTKELSNGTVKQLTIESMSLDEIGRLQIALTFRANL